jgi:uncharacterized protein YbjT (DUF2867 family)
VSRVLVAGASGFLGRELVGELKARGHRVRALIRNPRKQSVLGAADEVVMLDLLDPRSIPDDVVEGIDLVVSAAGQPWTLERTDERRSFRQVDPKINRALLEAALAAGVQRFAYVGVLCPEQLRHLPYVAAHEEFIEDLISSGLPHSVIRANGFFCSYVDLLNLARRGLAIGFGDGSARSNPIHEADLAAACIDAIEAEHNEIEIGGPEILTRQEEAELAFAAVGRNARLLRIPVPLLKLALPAMRLGDRRRAEMAEFIAAISRIDMLAPPHGSRRLSDYLRSR